MLFQAKKNLSKMEYSLLCTCK